MKPCQNGGCPRSADISARIKAIGDRSFCRPCADALGVLFGDDMRELEPNAFVPEWRKRGLARDESGRLVTA